MNISFDLDSTLIPNGEEFDTEKRSFWVNMLRIEGIRKGTRQLFSDIKNEGGNVHIYTTSYRSKSKIRWMLWFYGIKVDRIVNQTENQKVLKSLGMNVSKYPGAFGFDLHIDDSKGVAIEGERYHFKTIIIEPTNKNWIEHIKNELKKEGIG